MRNRKLSILFLFSVLTCYTCSTSEESTKQPTKQILSDKKYIHPKFSSAPTKQQFQIFLIHNQESYGSITGDTNNQIHNVGSKNSKANFKNYVYFLVKEDENPNKPDLFEINTVILNGQKGDLTFLADYDHLIIKSVETNTHDSGKSERNHHIREKIIPIKRNPTTENLYLVPRKVSDKVNLIRSKRYIFQFPKSILTISTNQLQIDIKEDQHRFSFDHFEEI
jgi:hypothetical protein